jgi:hypothetical protein
MENMEAIRRQATTTPLLPGMDHVAELAMTTAARATAPMGTIQMPAAWPFSNTRTDADCPAGDVLSIIEQMCTAPLGNRDRR